MSSATTMLLSSLLLLAGLLHGALSLTEGQRCSIHVPNHCDEGLTCVEYSGGDAYCQTVVRDPCATAACTGSLWCPPSLQYTPDGECCPICPPLPTVSVYTPPSGCTVNGVHHEEGASWKTDSCTTCQCTDGQHLCAMESCEPLSCDNSVVPPDQCCPVCLQVNLVEQAPASKKCVVDGKEYEDGERWTPDGSNHCNRALCDEGEVLYFSHSCAEPQCDNPVQHEGVCCPTCPDVTESRVEPVTTPVLVPECHLENGVTLRDGEKHCPAPNRTATCHAGVVAITHHCPPLDCINVIRGQEECDCPICVGDAHHFEVGGRLEMTRLQFAWRAYETDNMLRQLARDSGLYPEHNDFMTCNNMICVRMNVLSSDLTATEHDVVEAVRRELNSKPHEGLEIGTAGTFFTTEKRSARSVGDAAQLYEPLSLSSSPSSNKHTSAVTTAVALSASVLGVGATVVGLALLASFVRRRKTIRGTITV